MVPLSVVFYFDITLFLLILVVLREIRYLVEVIFELGSSAIEIYGMFSGSVMQSVFIDLYLLENLPYLLLYVLLCLKIRENHINLVELIN